MLPNVVFCEMFCRSLFLFLFSCFCSLHCLVFVEWLLITPLISFAHCIVWSLLNGFWLPLWYLLPIALSGHCFMASDYPFDIFCPLHCLVFVLWLLITHLVSFAHCIVWSSCYGFWLTLWYLLPIALSGLRFMASDYLFIIFKLFLILPLQCTLLQ